MKRICIIILVLLVSILLLSGCGGANYKILAGKLNISFGDSQDWVSIGKVSIDRLSEKSLIIPIEVYNDRSYNTTFQISLRTPDFVTGGYKTLSDESSIWIITTVRLLNVPAKSVGRYSIIVGVANKNSLWDNTEVWISAKEVVYQQVKVELCTRCLIKGNLK